MAGGTNRWGRAAFNGTNGWPCAVTFFRERLVYGRGRRVFMSLVGVYTDFQRKDGPDVTAETGIALELVSDQVDLIRWLAAGQVLLVGTARSEFSIQEQTTQQVFAADNVTANPQTEYGARLLEPLRVGNAVLFVQRAGRKLREMKFDLQTDRYVADDLTVLAEHILDAGVVDMDFQQEPDTLVWCAMEDGKLSALTYNRERGVVGWHPHTIGGGATVETVGCISSPDGKRDDLWMVCVREIDGETVRYVEFIEDNRLVLADVRDGFYVDCGITYSGAPATIITGLDHLEGATVQILADGTPHQDRTVVGGQVTLNRPSSRVHIGFNSPARLQTMRVEAPTQSGTGQSKRKSLASVALRFKDTIGGGAGPSFDRIDQIPGLDPTSTVGSLPKLFSGDREVTMPADYGKDGYVCVEQSQPLPMTLLSIVGRLASSEE